MKEGVLSRENNDESVNKKSNTKMNEEISQELTKLKEITNKIQIELNEKEDQTNKLSGKIEAISGNMTDLESSMKKEFDKNS